MTLIVWSGGCDSTVVLVERLLERARGEREEPIRTISFNVGQVAASGEQRRRRLALAWRLSSLGLDWEEHTELDVTAPEGRGVMHHGNPQAILWMLATQALDLTEDLLMGYIRGDDFFVDSVSFLSVFVTLQAVASRSGNIVFPLMDQTKREVVDRIVDYDLYSLVWWCQNEGPKPCGECRSCVAHETALWQRQRWPARG